ncbi:MAG: hypothetical protein K2N28_00595 [Muribaculaceae bacterium]|nr:hypothetical protein [Muribaculaceae bacterium]
MNETLHTRYYLNASECNAQRHISLPMLVQRLIEVATSHADELGVGYSHLRALSKTWVLSRLNLSMNRFPGINSYYNIDTWVSAINRHFTERCFCITDDDGNILGEALTVWFAIDLETRRGGDMTEIMGHAKVSDRQCNVGRGSKIPPVTAPDMVRDHKFGFCDIDFNRHVNSTRYIEALLNSHTVDFYDTHPMTMFEIAYMDEICYNDRVEIASSTDGNVTTYEITRDGSPVTRARLAFD